MRSEIIDSLARWPAEQIPLHGVLVLSGYGLSICVWRGRLRVAYGIGRDRHEALVHRATGRLRRLVVLGHTGSVSLEAIRWLADIGAGYLQIDADGRVLAAFGPQGSDRPGLRRAQGIALGTPLGDCIARRLIAEKVAAQAATLLALDAALPVADDVVAALRVAAVAIDHSEDRVAVRIAEASAASAYWSAWSALPVAFAKRDVDRLPAHWRTVGSRTSPLTGGPRLAGNPANALLNYCYALLEAEATLAARVVGLDPGLGVLHADQRDRDSLAADLMEPVRPLVDRFVLGLLASRSFAASDFHETRQGVCRITPPLARELAVAGGQWRRPVGHVAEDVARFLDGGDRRERPVPTPVSGRLRSSGRPAGPRAQRSAGASSPIGRRCSWCGNPTDGERRTCSDACERERRAVGQATFSGAGAARLRQLRAAGFEPMNSDAKDRIARSQRERQREENEWNADHPEPRDPDGFRRDVLPAIQGVPLRELARRTGLSVPYCGRIRRGVEVPHPRWWGMLVGTAG
jgi:CRISPR-associated endonuclease Cas1